MGLKQGTSTDTGVSEPVSEPSLEEYAQALRSNTGLSTEQIRNRVNNKMSEYPDLLNKKGACILVGNDEGVDLNRIVQINRSIELDVCNIVDGMQDLCFEAKIGEVEDIVDKEDTDWRLQKIELYDDSGSIEMVAWNEDIEFFLSFRKW